jgi:hypothetical protein
MPEGFEYDGESLELRFGVGVISPVSQAVVDYTTSGMPVLRKWFAYRQAIPAGKSSGVLSKINSNHWYEEWTDDLVGILSRLTWLVALETTAEPILKAVARGPLLNDD